jgi:hypothetical protein
MFTPKNIPALLSSLPMVLTKMIGRKIDKKARRLAARFNL